MVSMQYLQIIILLSLVSCSTYVRTVGSRMISPEAHGKLGKGQLEARVQKVQVHQVDFSGSSTDQKLEQKGADAMVAGNAELGLWTKLDIFVLPSFIMSPTLFGAKFQFLGDSRLEAKQGNFSASIMGAIGSKSESRKDGEGDDDIFDGQIDKINSDLSHQDIGLVVGYRWFDRLLHYANGIWYEETFKGKVTNNDRSLDNAKFEYNNHGVILSTGLIYYFQVVHLKADFSHLVTNWSHTRSITTNSYNFAFGFSW